MTFETQITKLSRVAHCGGLWWIPIFCVLICKIITYLPQASQMADNQSTFFGEFENIPLDVKGRLIIPAPLRNALPNGVTSMIVTKLFDDYLMAFDPYEWRRRLDQLRNMGRSQADSRQLVRTMAGRAYEVKLDRQGRALIPRKHLDLVGITDRATLTGVVDCIEIWDPDKYNEVQNDVDIEAIAEKLEW